MKASRGFLLSAAAVVSVAALAFAQAPPGGGRGRGPAAPRLVFSVTSDAWPDGGEVPMKYSGRGENKSPAFEFHWTLGGNAAPCPIL